MSHSLLQPRPAGTGAFVRGHPAPPQRPSLPHCRGLKENVAQLPPTAGIVRVVIPGAAHSIDNVEGKKASVAIYAHLEQQYGGRLTPEAAARGLELYDEVVADARQHPGSHPNIDLLLRVTEEGLALELVVEREAAQ